MAFFTMETLSSTYILTSFIDNPLGVKAEKWEGKNTIKNEKVFFFDYVTT